MCCPSFGPSTSFGVVRDGASAAIAAVQEADVRKRMSTISTRRLSSQEWLRREEHLPTTVAEVETFAEGDLFLELLPVFLDKATGRKGLDWEGFRDEFNKRVQDFVASTGRFIPLRLKTVPSLKKFADKLQQRYLIKESMKEFKAMFLELRVHLRETRTIAHSGLNPEILAPHVNNPSAELEQQVTARAAAAVAQSSGSGGSAGAGAGSSGEADTLPGGCPRPQASSRGTGEASVAQAVKTVVTSMGGIAKCHNQPAAVFKQVASIVPTATKNAVKKHLNTAFEQQLNSRR